MKEDISATIIQIGSIRDMTYQPKALGYRALTNAIKYLKEYEDLLNEQGAKTQVCEEDQE